MHLEKGSAPAPGLAGGHPAQLAVVLLAHRLGVIQRLSGQRGIHQGKTLGAEP